VLGSPIAHSLSPVLHSAAYAELNLPWRYDAIECDEERLPRFLNTLDSSWVGLSLTMPLKRAVLPLLDDVSELATAVGGANTVVLHGGRRRGENTDVAGIVGALREAGVAGVASVVILGGGATACAVVAALPELAARQAALVVRNPARTSEVRATADRLGIDVEVHPLDDLDSLLPADLVISTLPSGTADPYAHLIGSRAGTVFDVVYEPWPTKLAAAAQAAGLPVVSGFDLLLHQAVPQIELMTMRSPAPLEAMRAAGERELLDRGSS
jgi:shikimate dehydrogenase